MQKEIVKVWNVHGLDEGDDALVNRTSNALERYNRWFNSLVPNPHPNLQTFGSALREEADRIVNRVEAVRKCHEKAPVYKEVVFPNIPASFESFSYKFVEGCVKKSNVEGRVKKSAQRSGMKTRSKK